MCTYRMISQKHFIDFKLTFEIDNDLAVRYTDKEIDEKEKQGNLASIKNFFVSFHNLSVKKKFRVEFFCNIV